MTVSTQTKALLWGLAGVGAWVALKSGLARQRKIDFQGKTVVITGGSRGLGLEMARILAQEGANLALCARNPAELDDARNELLAYGGRVYTQTCDLTDKRQIEDFIEDVRQALGPVDVLINNAGTILVTPFEHSTEADLRESMDTNFWSAFHTINAVLPHMRPRKAGRIVNVTSFGGKVSIPHLLTYSASKFAFVGYSEGIRPELQKEGIYVTTICPGLIRTGSPRNAYFKGQNEKEYAAFKIAGSLPFFTIDSAECAREIIEACRYGEAERIIGLPAKIGASVQGLAPNLLAEVMGVVARLLPNPGGIAEEAIKGKYSETPLSESFLTTLTDQAALRNNERAEE
ncbi:MULTISPECIES: SDR family oxidoreductase [unclassified Spirosoma]|uniref:SDR family NAD(P)-dependent oxidoreductase n=1 Tax=unclassified Spirosoma TaxID=2621999 RepID=UPI00095C1555|nr:MULTISPECIES: SDR family oxidoreductase [unclassified Spirosoma]MBN8823474.1 SDR family oxidoreductase [Spirosoma sp.]OJW72017.1 MAG: ketoacyl reductase [Spirosoma sp. 48-14]